MSGHIPVSSPQHKHADNSKQRRKATSTFLFNEMTFLGAVGSDCPVDTVLPMWHFVRRNALQFVDLLGSQRK
jgi:hypothetical protein